MVAKDSATGLESSATHLLHRAAQYATQLFDAQSEASRFDLTERQVAVLMALESNEGASQTRLVELTGIDRSTLAEIMRRLIKKGLVERSRTKQDARAYAVKLTAQGRKQLGLARPAFDNAEKAFLGALSAGGRKEFVAALQKISAASEQATAKKRV